MEIWKHWWTELYQVTGWRALRGSVQKLFLLLHRKGNIPANWWFHHSAGFFIAKIFIPINNGGRHSVSNKNTFHSLLNCPYPARHHSQGFKCNANPNRPKRKRNNHKRHISVPRLTTRLTMSEFPQDWGHISYVKPHTNFRMKELCE